MVQGVLVCAKFTLPQTREKLEAGIQKWTSWIWRSSPPHASPSKRVLQLDDCFWILPWYYNSMNTSPPHASPSKRVLQARWLLLNTPMAGELTGKVAMDESLVIPKIKIIVIYRDIPWQRLRRGRHGGGSGGGGGGCGWYSPPYNTDK